MKQRSRFLSFSRWRKKNPIKFYVLIALLGLLLLMLYASNHSWKKSHYQVSSPKISNAFNGFKICQISDLHGRIPGNGSDFIADIQEEKPDIIVFTGDTVNPKKNEQTPFLEYLQKISQIAPSYMIPGNTELLWAEEKPEEEKTFQTEVTKRGITLLENRSVPILRRGSRIFLAGLREDFHYYPDYRKGVSLPVGQFLKREKESYEILLAHNPEYWPDYLTWGADLTLSGHLHGGMVRLPFLGGLFTPEGGLMPGYDKGLYKQGNQAMVVSAGLGVFVFPWRWMNPPDLVFIDLQSQSIH